MKQKVLWVSVLLLATLSQLNAFSMEERCSTKQIAKREQELWSETLQSLKKEYGMSSHVTFKGSLCAHNRFVNLSWQDDCSKKHSLKGELVLGENNLNLYRYVKSGVQIFVFDMSVSSCENFAAFLGCGSTQESRCLATHWQVNKNQQCLINLPSEAAGIEMREIYDRNLGVNRTDQKPSAPYLPEYSVIVTPVKPKLCTQTKQN